MTDDRQWNASFHTQAHQRQPGHYESCRRRDYVRRRLDQAGHVLRVRKTLRMIKGDQIAENGKEEGGSDRAAGRCHQARSSQCVRVWYVSTSRRRTVERTLRTGIVPPSPPAAHVLTDTLRRACPAAGRGACTKARTLQTGADGESAGGQLGRRKCRCSHDEEMKVARAAKSSRRNQCLGRQASR